MAEFIERSGSYIIRGPGDTYAGWAENVLIAQRWVRLLTSVEEDIRQAMLAGRQDEVHALYERVEAEARAMGPVREPGSEQVVQAGRGSRRFQ